MMHISTRILRAWAIPVLFFLSPNTVLGQSNPMPSTQVQQGGVVVNGAALTPQQEAQLGGQPGQIQPGQYWYDARTGAWGMQGAGVQGFVQPGLQLGTLQADASNGHTGVFINGRQLPQTDLMQLQQAVGSPVPPGRYWCEANGHCGQEGSPQPLVRIQLGGGSSGGGIPEWGSVEGVVDYEFACSLNGGQVHGWARLERTGGTATFWTNDSYEGEISEVQSDGTYSLDFKGAINTPQVTYNFEHDIGQYAQVWTGAPQHERFQIVVQGSYDGRGIEITLNPDPVTNGQYAGEKIHCTFTNHQIVRRD